MSATTPPPGLGHNFRLLWAGEGISVLGSMTTTVVFPLIAVTQFDAGPFWMGILAGAVWLPWLVLGLVAGAWVDRSDPRRVMMRADLAAAAIVGSVPLAWALDVLTLPHLVVTALGLGCCMVFFRTAYTAFVPRVVASDDLERANARIYGTESAMQVGGPGIGGLLVQLFSAAYVVLLDVVTFLVSWWCLARMRPEELGAGPEREASEPLVRQIREGVIIVARDPYFRFMTLLGGLGNFALTGYGALLVLFLVRDLHLQPGSVGLVMGFGSVGGLVGATLATRTSQWLGNAGALRWLQVVGGPPALLIGLAWPGTGAAVVALGSFFVGAGVVGANVVRSSFRLRYTPPELLGRTMATSAVLNFGTMPLAALVAGALGTWIGVRETILLMAAIHAVGSLTVFVGPYARGRDLPDQMARWTSGSMATARKSSVT
ncbi:arabinose ABC transporter permease [Knoellia sinensis KCTC 19936]|uniref:Arabinose ABC transporter permease n=1 Tax=Knoellia sinensis KCTC 19936 TaxID=1385520 RepID=A0A0A0J738_9MICO|nr:MFS transporter [Knoellia sinensis]KGN32579.1 arabinose ABC transporter permease [Knoellia sinensis KCTC 19936]